MATQNVSTTAPEINNAETEFDAIHDMTERLNLLGLTIYSNEMDEAERAAAALLIKESCARIFEHAERLLAMATAKA